MRMWWSVNRERRDGSSTFGMWQEMHFSAGLTGHRAEDDPASDAGEPAAAAAARAEGAAR